MEHFDSGVTNVKTLILGVLNLNGSDEKVEFVAPSNCGFKLSFLPHTLLISEAVFTLVTRSHFLDVSVKINVASNGGIFFYVSLKNDRASPM